MNDSKSSIFSNLFTGRQNPAADAAGIKPARANVPAFHLSPDDTARLIRLYAANPVFANTERWVIEDNPYRRPVNQAAVEATDFSKALVKADAFTASALAAHRMLLNIYESDLLFLPDDGFAAKKDDFALFYSNENKLLGELIRPALEAHVFGFLEDEIAVNGDWSLDALKAYLSSLLEAHEQSELEIATAILTSADPVKNALAFLVQVASDFLSEASATARNALGKYGAIQSELFKIVIDDYGYGVHQSKHSTLFENTMASCGLSTQAHSYWQFYLGSSLAMGNYYHYVSRDHSKFFKCLGAMAFAETMFAHTCRRAAEMLRRVFGKSVDTHYFDEHGHIDAHHGRMAIENIIAPAVAKHGDGIIEQIVRGLEEIRLLTALSDADFTAQIAWADAMRDYKRLARALCEKVASGGLNSSRTTHVKRQNDPLITQVYDEDKLCVLEYGLLNMVGGHDRSIRIAAGEGIVIPRHRLNGIEAGSGECLYHIYDIGDYKTRLS
jgi:hypothetical protein